MVDGVRSIAGRVALVTGAASGIGRATAALFAAEGARVAGVDRPGWVDGGAPADFVAVEADLATDDGPSSCVSLVRDALGPIDVVVNAAGVSLPAALGSAALAVPTLRCSSWVPPPAGISPTPTSGRPKTAVRSATTRSQESANSVPPPKAKPWTAATVGCGR